MKTINIILISMMTLLLSGCVTPILFTGTVVGAGYVKEDIEHNYYGDSIEYVKDKYYMLVHD